MFSDEELHTLTLLFLQSSKACQLYHDRTWTGHVLLHALVTGVRRGGKVTRFDINEGAAAKLCSFRGLCVSSTIGLEVL